MKYIPILFSTPMVQAILEDRKTMTRRIVKPRSQEDYALMINMEAGVNVQKSIEELVRCSCPYGQPGDILWVRETLCATALGGAVYKAGGKVALDKELGETEFIDFETFTTKKIVVPSIHMPKSACRIFLEVTDVRVERLQDISEEDAIAEGVERNRDGSWHDYISPERISQDCAKASFQSLWLKINGPESWTFNPFVWVISFKRINKPENF